MSIIEDQNLFWTEAQSLESEVFGSVFIAFKRTVDFTSAFVLLAITTVVAAALFVLNPLFNRGTVFYAATRMGQDCKPFTVYKFRTMVDGNTVGRGANDPLEANRITPLGAVLRKFRIDEFPQAINILRGEMSLVGPRPDDFSQAVEYMARIPNYSMRHVVRPGITGLAQVESGYAISTNETMRKVQLDMRYILNTSIWSELAIMAKTVGTIIAGAGK